MYRHNELLIWSAGLVVLYFTNDPGESHFSFCFFKWLGFSHCPGCGIGRSIHAVMHFDFIS
ncbi:MAG: DUF2752 domain-containing protein, partial [Bacteroidetes bacterium]|nr:DUF2752 domain-containing protein [Bacteroidota bacterium]